MKRLHLALSTQDIQSSVADYSERLGYKPSVMIPHQYALWRTPALNLSIRQDASVEPGRLRHLGWETPSTLNFTKSKDVNGIEWESFTAQQQADEINEIWPLANYTP